MTGGLLTAPDRKERLSLIYVKALAARAGFLTSVPEPDRDSVDLRIQAGGTRRPALDLQLKATGGFDSSRNGHLPFRLSLKNYGDLRIETQTPRLLVVLELPREEEQWLTVTTEKLVLRRRAYWLSLQRDHRDITDQQTVTVHIPEQNIFDVKTLRNLMERSREGEL